MDIKEIEALLEGILFAAGDPVRIDRLCAVMECDPQLIDSTAMRLADYYRYERRGIRLVKLENAYQLVSAPDCAEQVRKILEERKPPPMSRATLETLAIIAYNQPTTRAYIEMVRGVDSSNTVSTLQEKGLIEECGRLEVPGRPMLFRTTPIFLRCFGLQSISDLPILDTPEGEIEGQVTFGQAVARDELPKTEELLDGLASLGVELHEAEEPQADENAVLEDIPTADSQTGSHLGDA